MNNDDEFQLHNSPIEDFTKSKLNDDIPGSPLSKIAKPQMDTEATIPVDAPLSEDLVKTAENQIPESTTSENTYEKEQQTKEQQEVTANNKVERAENATHQEKEVEQQTKDNDSDEQSEEDERPVDLTSNDRALRVEPELRLSPVMLGIEDVEHTTAHVMPIEHERRNEDAENLLHLPSDNQEYMMMSKYYAELEKESYETMCNANTVDIDPDHFLNYEENKPWNSVLDDSYYAMANNHTFYKRLARGKWSQGLHHADKHWGICSPQLGEASGIVQSEEEAMYRIMDETGDGRFESIYLIHSGFWIKIKPPEADDILDYYRIVNEDKIKLGRHTYGRVYSNVSVIQERRALTFCLRHNVASSLNIPVKNVKKYLDVIDMRDMGAILWGMAEAMYPDGFDYDVACSADPNACNFVHEGTLKVRNLLWEDNSSLTTEMKDFLLFAEAKSLTTDDIAAYKAKLSANEKNKFIVPFKTKTKELHITMRHPTLSDKISAGERWIDDCSKGVLKAFDEDPTDDQRNIYLNNNAKITYLRQYGMFIEQIKVGNSIIPKDKIDKPLKALSSKKVLREGIIKAITEFIEENQLSVVGIPKFKCPTCHKPAREDGRPLNPYLANIIPMDPLQTFFTVTGMKIIQISERDL